MKTTAIVVALAVLAMSIPAQAAPMKTIDNEAWWIDHYAEMIEANKAADLSLPDHSVDDLMAAAGFQEALDTIVARTNALGIDLSKVSASGESGAFPLVGDSALIQDYFSTVPPPASASCNQSPAFGTGGHYDNIYANGPVTTDPGAGMIFVGDATSTFGTTGGVFNVAYQLPLGFFGGIPNLGAPPAKAFVFSGVDLSYTAESDFWCYSLVFCFFGFCYYEELNFPYLRGLTLEQ